MVLLLLMLALAPFRGSDASKLMWSVQPLSRCKLSNTGVWEDVPDTNITLNLPNELPLLVSYDFAAVAFKPESATNDFILDEDMSLGQKDFLQMRVVVDDIPFRQSSSHAQPSSSMESGKS